MKSYRLLSMTCAVALSAGALAALAPSPPSEAAAPPVRIALNPATATEPFEGWGTSLVWFANATGNYPAEVRQKLFDAVFGDDGLNLNIARYNIGGGNATDVPPYLRPGGAVPGFWNPELTATDADGEITSTYADRDRYRDAWNPDDPTHYDFSADSGQRWWLDALKDKVTHWEAFSNSPPYFLTDSGFVSGGINDATSEQLASADMEKFAGYLVTVVDELEKAHGIRFDTIDPFNEPNTNYWSTRIDAGQKWPWGGRQEGAHIGPQRQDEMIKALADRLGRDDTTTDAVISAMDETNPGIFAGNWNTWSDASKDAVDQLNVHTYGTSGRPVVRDIAKAADKPLWMSEVEGNWTDTSRGFVTDDIENGLGMASHIVGDLRELEPAAWVFWQPVEDLYNMEKVEKLNWGSVFIDFDCNAQGLSERRIADGDADPSCQVLTNEKFNTVRNFTHYIKPGDRLIASSDAQSTAAIDADGTGATVVHVNSDAAERTVEIDLSDFATIAPGATVTPVVTTQSTPEDPSVNALKTGAPVAVNAATKTAVLTVPAKSVTTFVVDGVSGVADQAPAFRDGQNVQLVGVQSGLALDGGASPAIRADATTADAARTQTWTVRTVSDPGTNRHRFTLENAAGQFLGSSDGGTVLVDSEPAAAAADPALTWMASTTDGEVFSILNVAAERVLDVNGASAAAGTRVGLWPSNGGGNQLWHVRGTAVRGVDAVRAATAVGTAPALPNSVTVRYEGTVTRPAPVTWDTAGKDWSKAGTVAVRGTGTDIFGTAFEASAVVEVGAFTATRPVSMTVAAGASLAAVTAAAPTEVPAEIRADGAGFPVAVQWQWDGVTDASFAAPGTVVVNGTVAATTGEKLPARLSVIVTAATERNVARESRASASFSEDASYGPDRTINGVTSDKGWSNWRPGTLNAQDTLTYALSGDETLSRVTVQYYRDGGPSWPTTMRVDHRQNGGAWVEGTLQQVPMPATGAPKVEVALPRVAADEVRVVMNARADTHLIVSEVEILAVSPSPAGIADLARLTVGDRAVVGFDPARTEYSVQSSDEGWPVVGAQAVDDDAAVTITQPAEANGTATVRVVAPDGTQRTYTVAVSRAPTVKVSASVASRCIGGRVTYVVSVRNDETVSATVTATTPYGKKVLTGMKPGSRLSFALSTRKAATPAATATVDATASRAGGVVRSSATIALPAASCR